MEASKQALIAAVREVAARTGARRLTLARFRAAVAGEDQLVYRHFDGWAELCRAAGLEPGRRGVRVPDKDAFEALRDGFLAAGGIVPRNRLRRHLPPGAAVPDWRWGGWIGTLAAFRDWAKANAPDFPYLGALETRIASGMAARQKRRASLGQVPARVPAWPARGVRPLGDPLGFRALLHAPVNENGVILLFGMVAGELGFAIDSVQPGFPDCAAKRRVAPQRWESVRIEFEHRSRSFREHGHDPAGCDLIVCWEHDWPDCPLEVLALRDAIAALPAAPG